MSEHQPFTLQFDASMIPALASRYSYSLEDHITDEIGPAVRERGYFNRSEFIEVCRWKTPRSAPLVKKNFEEEVQEATRLALSATTELLRICIPMVLSGILLPTASVLLHFGHQDRYPIIDYRALEALGVMAPVSYTMPFWNAYVIACRKIDDETGYGMRVIDRAMWQWSKEQPQRR
jgi:hypothetical protein